MITNQVYDDEVWEHHKGARFICLKQIKAARCTFLYGQNVLHLDALHLKRGKINFDTFILEDEICYRWGEKLNTTPFRNKSLPQYCGHVQVIIAPEGYQ